MMAIGDYDIGWHLQVCFLPIWDGTLTSSGVPLTACAVWTSCGRLAVVYRICTLVAEQFPPEHEEGLILQPGGAPLMSTYFMFCK